MRNVRGWAEKTTVKKRGMAVRRKDNEMEKRESTNEESAFSASVSVRTESVGTKKLIVSRQPIFY